MVLWFIFKFLCHFEFISVHGVRVWTNLMSLSNFPNNTCKRDCLFSTVYSCLLCQRLIDLGVWVHFWVLFSVPLMYMSFFVPISHCFDYCRLVELSEVWEGYASYTVLFPQDCFGYSGSSIQFSSSVMSDSLRPHRLQHSRLPCPPPLPRACSNLYIWVGDAIQPFHPQSFPSPPAFRLSQHQDFCQWLVLCIRWPKFWSFSFSLNPSNEYSRLISFRVDQLDLLSFKVPCQGTLKSLLQHHSSKASILQSSTFFLVQLSHPYMTTAKTHSFD